MLYERNEECHTYDNIPTIILHVRQVRSLSDLQWRRPKYFIDMADAKIRLTALFYYDVYV